MAGPGAVAEQAFREMGRGSTVHGEEPMGMGTTLWLGGAMAVIAVANTALMAWL